MELRLPTAIVSRFDVTRLIRELDTLEDFFAGAKVRPAGSAMPPPRLSRLLNQLSNDNRINLLEETQRQKLKTTLEMLLKQAPQIHMSFSVDPSPKAIEQILIWLRTNIHPAVLLQVGLQPNIAAGCMLRTSNKWFDLSLKPRLEQDQPYLMQLIGGAVSGQ